MVDETTLPVSSGEASPAAPAPEEQGPIAPTKSYRLTPRAPGGTYLTQPAEPLREEAGPPVPSRGIGGGIADWIEKQRSVAGTYGYEHPAVSSARSFADHVGLKRDDSYDPWPDIEGTDFAGNAQFLQEAMFVGSRGELDLLKRRHMEEEANAQIRSQNPVSTFVWGLLGAPFDPTNLLPGGAVYRSGRLGLGIARSALEGAAAGAAGGLASEVIAQNTLHTRTPQDLLTSTAMGAGFGGLIGIGGSVLGEVLGRSASQLSKSEFNRLAQNIEVGPRPVFDDVRRQLVGAGLPEEEAAANAAIWQARYAARAERRGLGESAFDLYRTENVDIRAGEAPEELGDDVLAQAARWKEIPVEDDMVVRGSVRRGAGGHDVVAFDLFPRPPEGQRLPDGIDGILGRVELVRRDDGRWEVDWANVPSRERGKGYASKLYDVVEKELGAAMVPSGTLLPDGHAFWAKRNPEAVQWHRKVDGAFYSPRRMEEELTGLRAEEAADPGATGTRIQAFEHALSTVPPEGRTSQAMARMFQSARSASASPEFQRWFGDSKVVDAAGHPLKVYHGAQRSDRIAERGKFDKKRATSGPMSFFTDNPEVASSYATTKLDTSLHDEEHLAERFQIKVPGSRRPVRVDKAWWGLDPAERQRIGERAGRVTIDDDGDVVLAPEGHRNGAGNYDQEIREARGNHLAALSESWLNSGLVFGEEEKFGEVLRLAGLQRPFEYVDPFKEASGVVPTYLSIRSPLDTSAIPAQVIAALEDDAKGRRAPRDTRGKDQWDKRAVNPRDWIDRLHDDAREGTAHAWTSIPDWVTERLRALGFDGIKDTGGKNGGTRHTVWIPFDETQVKSAVGNRGTFDPADPRILYQSIRNTGSRGVPIEIDPATPVPVSDLGQRVPRTAGKAVDVLRSKAGEHVTASGQKITVSVNASKKLISQFTKDLRPTIVQHLDEVLRGTVMYGRLDDFRYGVAHARIDGKDYVVRLVVKHGEDGVDRVHQFEGFDLPPGGAEQREKVPPLTAGEETPFPKKAGGEPAKTVDDLVSVYKDLPDHTYSRFQAGEGAPRGAITMESNRALIELFRGRDQSTFMHESSHLWLSELIRDAEVSPAMKEDLDQVLTWLGVDDASKIGRAEHEKWAQGFEQYLREGKAPSSALQRAFDQFKAWLSAIYKSLSDLGEPIPDEIRGVMDRMLAAEERPDSAGGLGASGGAAYRWEEGNRLKSSLGAAEMAGKTPIYGSPVAFVQTSPIAATRRAAEWIGDGRLSYAKNAEGVPTAADEAIGLRGNLDDVKRLARAKYAAFTRTLEDLYSQYRFGRHKRLGDNVRQMFPDQQHLDFADFKSEVFHAANMGDKHAIPEVAKAAGEFRKIADALADKAVEIGIWNEKPSPAGTLSYATHMFNTRLVGKRKQEFVADTQAFYAADQQVKSRLQSRMQDLAQQRDEMEVRARKLQRRMETVDRQEQELAARTSERGMEARRAGRRADQLGEQATGAAEQATSLDEFVGAVKGDLNSPEARAEIDDLRAQAREMSRLAKPRTQADIARAARFERDAVLSGIRLAAEIVIGRKRSYEPPSFLRWIARQGGVSDPNGSLKGSDIALRGVVAAKGRSFDQLGERIAEEARGLLPGRPGANEVEDWIVQAARGEEPGWWTARHLDAEHAGQSRVAQEIQQMAVERGVSLRTLDDVATFLRGEEGRPQTLEDLERRVAGEEGMRSEGMTGGALAEEARQALEGALGDRASARAAVRDAMVALAGVRRRMGRAETKAEEALRALTANKDRMETLSDRAIDLSVRRQMLEAAMANHEAEAAALRTKMEEVVGAWNGNSSKGAKRALEKREAATAGAPADAPRLKTADSAVDDAAEAILKARTDLTPDELRARAEETWQRVVGTPAGRFPYDDQAPTGGAIRSGKEELGRTFQGRTFALPFETKAKWLETDIEHVARVMIEQMEMDMAIVQRFGSVTDMGGLKHISADGSLVFREIADEAQRQMDQFAADYQAKNGREPTAKEIEAANERIKKRADDDIETLMKLLERQRGLFGMPDNPQGVGHQAARVARGFNILTSLGSVLISSMSDLATPLVRHGMIELLGNGWAPFVSSIGREVGGRAKEELRLMGVGLDLELNARMAAFSDVLDDYGRGSPLERAVGASVNKFMALTMLPQWTDMGERVVGYTVMSKTLKAAQAATEGRLSARQREMLAGLGISEPMAARIWKEFAADGGGERFNGLWLTNTSAWQDQSAAEAMSIAVGRGVERSIVRPGMERPFWSQGNEVGRLVFQFQSFMTATAQTVTLAGIQQRDARAIMGFAAMVGLGAMSFAARQAVQGREVPTDPVKLVVEGLSTSGLLGWLDQANTIAEKATSGRVGLSALTGEYTSRYSNVNEMGTLLGPVAGKVQDAVFSGGRFIGDMARPRGQAPYAHRADLAALRRSFLPGQNFWFLRRAIDNLEDGLGDALGMKPRKRTLKVGAQ